MSGRYGRMYDCQGAANAYCCFQDAKAMGKLKREVERARRILSSQNITKIGIEGFHQRKGLSETLTRARFVDISPSIFP